MFVAKEGASPIADVAALTSSHFIPFIGSEFLLDQVALRLVDVALAPSVRDNGRPFSIVLEGSRHTPLEQNLYSISHPEMGVMDLFIVPIEQDDASRRYEAVFN